MICPIFMEPIPPALPPLREELTDCVVMVNMIHIYLISQGTKLLQTLWEPGECYQETDFISSFLRSFAFLSNKVVLWRKFLQLFSQ